MLTEVKLIVNSRSYLNGIYDIFIRYIVYTESSIGIYRHDRSNT